jgi:hypothetical protein
LVSEIKGRTWKAFGKRVLRRTFEAKKDEALGRCRKLQSKELHNVCSSSYVIRIIKSRRMRRKAYVACMEAKKNACRILMGNPEETSKKT